MIQVCTCKFQRNVNDHRWENGIAFNPSPGMYDVKVIWDKDGNKLDITEVFTYTLAPGAGSFTVDLEGPL